MDAELLKKYIEIGSSEDFDVLKILFAESEVERQGEIMRQGVDWYDVAALLKDSEIVALIKTFTVAEKILPGWEAGSVSPVIWLYRKLKERNYPKIDDFTDWILVHTNNGYVPFTNFGAKSLEELERRRHQYELRKTEVQRREDERKQAGVVKRQRKVVSYRLRIENQKKEKGQRLAILNKLQKMTPAERLNYIANDDEYSILFYPDQYANVNDSVLNSLDSQIILKLIEKIGARKKGAWKRLASALKASRQK